MKIIIICCFVFIACENEIKKEYYKNGNIKKEFSLKHGKYDGVLKKYFDTGDLKELHIYSDGSIIDSSLYFNPGGILKYTEYHLVDSTTSKYRKYYYTDRSLKSEGAYNKFGSPIARICNPCPSWASASIFLIVHSRVN